MFSIWTKGIADCLNLMPGGGMARLTSLGHQSVPNILVGVDLEDGTYLQSATPSLRPSRRSDDDSFSPSVSSIQARTSFAAAGVYLSRRNLRRSLSKELTDAMMATVAVRCRRQSVGFKKRWPFV